MTIRRQILLSGVVIQPNPASEKPAKNLLNSGSDHSKKNIHTHVGLSEKNLKAHSPYQINKNAQHATANLSSSQLGAQIYLLLPFFFLLPFIFPFLLIKIELQLQHQTPLHATCPRSHRAHHRQVRVGYCAAYNTRLGFFTLRCPERSDASCACP